jgi:hypothetical protein
MVPEWQKKIGSTFYGRSLVESKAAQLKIKASISQGQNVFDHNVYQYISTFSFAVYDLTLYNNESK